jgi:hypothetical protein
MTLLTSLIPLHLQGFEYVIQDLGTLADAESHAIGINHQNAIVGYTNRAGETRTFIWQPKNGLTLLPHPNYQSPLINNHNQVVDIFWHTTHNWFANNTTSKHIYMYDNGYTQDVRLPMQWKMQELEHWKTATSLWDDQELGILAFNDQKQILITNAKQLDKATRFAIWQGSKFQEIDNKVISNAYGMNNQGIILGRQWVKKENGTVPMLVVYNPSKGTVVEITKDINLVNRRINDLGQVIGFQALKDSPAFPKVFFWDPIQGLFQLEDFFPMALNNCCQIVGFTVSKMPGEESTPVIWAHGKFFPLTNITGFGGIESLWSKLKFFTGINDNGYIIGEGLFDNKPHAFVLVPK